MSTMALVILLSCVAAFLFGVMAAIAHTFRDDRPTPWDGGPPL